MKVLKTFAFAQAVGSKSTHDWDTILDGKIRELTSGEDFECKVATFATLVRSAAKKRGLKVRTTKTETGIVVQSYKDESADSE